MALFPCAVGLHRYAGRQQSAYLGIVNGSISTREKLRLCSVHFVELRAFLEEHLELAAIGDTTKSDDHSPAPKCCEKWSTEGGFTVYANLYPAGEEQHQFWALMCADHMPLFAERAQIVL